MFYKLSISNVKRSFKDYAIYFITLILGVCIFYVFNSMDSQTAMLTVTSRQSEMIDLLIEVLSYVSIFVSLILGLLIIYASRFLMKKRNKEFGIYMTLGMSKRKISFLLLVETFIIGLVSLVVGLVLGIVLSQVTSIFIANMFEADMTKFTFNFSSSAMIKSIIYFGIIYFIVMVFNTIIVSKNKLINLLQASKKQEKIRLKNPIICIILFVISVLLLGTAYYLVTEKINELLKYDVSILLVPISLGVLGTVIFFYSVAGMLLKILSKCHNLYSKNLNTFVFKQISSKINTMVISISIICLMLFITLCLLSSAFTIKNFFNDSINKYAPVDFELIGYYKDKWREGSDEDEIKDINLMDFIDSDSVIKNNTKDITVVTDYFDENLTYGTSLGNYEETIRKQYPYVQYNNLVEIMSQSEFNKLAKVYHFEEVSLKSNEYAIVSNYESNLYEEVIKANSIINIYGNNLQPYGKIIDGFKMIGGNPSNLGFFVVDDSIIKSENKHSQILVGNYSTNDENIINNIEEKIDNYMPGFAITKDTKFEIKEASVGLSAIVTFIGLYLGIIFLISSSAILALKELSDCLDDKNKYNVLRQIGADEKEINKALFKQTLIFFMLPLSLAIIHTIFGLKFCTWILNSMGVKDILDGSVITFAFLILIYGIYFVITYMCSKNIIKEK